MHWCLLVLPSNPKHWRSPAWIALSISDFAQIFWNSTINQRQVHHGRIKPDLFSKSKQSFVFSYVITGIFISNNRLYLRDLVWVCYCTLTLALLFVRQASLIYLLRERFYRQVINTALNYLKFYPNDPVLLFFKAFAALNEGNVRLGWWWWW